MKILKIQCPKCGVIISLRNVPNLLTKSLECPRCHCVNKIVDYYLPQSEQKEVRDEGATRYAGHLNPQNNNRNLQNGLPEVKEKLGTLLDKSTGEKYQLLNGRNVIGRKSNTSSSNVQILTSDLHVSRQHFYIDVDKNGAGYYYVISNANKRNKTKVNEQILDNGDQIQLTKGDVIQIGSVKLEFVS